MTIFIKVNFQLINYYKVELYKYFKISWLPQDLFLKYNKFITIVLVLYWKGKRLFPWASSKHFHYPALCVIWFLKRTVHFYLSRHIITKSSDYFNHLLALFLNDNIKKQNLMKYRTWEAEFMCILYVHLV